VPLAKLCFKILHSKTVNTIHLFYPDTDFLRFRCFLRFVKQSLPPKEVKKQRNISCTVWVTKNLTLLKMLISQIAYNILVFNYIHKKEPSFTFHLKVKSLNCDQYWWISIHFKIGPTKLLAPDCGFPAEMNHR